MKYRIGIQVLSFNKPKYLKKTLDSLTTVMSQRDKICVLEQSDKPELKEECLNICKQYNDIHVIDISENKGQRGATNIVYKSGFFNDCEFVMLSDHDNVFHEPLTTYCIKLNEDKNVWVATGYNSPEHDFERKDGEWIRKSSARAGHMVLRQEDFLSLCPINEEFGSKTPDYGCGWFCGLDWWITHWCTNSPGHKRPEIIAVFPGGVEHIGRESTWQGSYDDEYDQETNLWFRKASTYDIVKKYKPRHEYMHYKYWYETVDLEQLKKLEDGKLSSPPERPQGGDIDRLKNLLREKLNVKLDNIDPKYFKSPFPQEEVKEIVEVKEINLEYINKRDSNIIAFNYLWPAYGYQFLERSIKSVLPYVKKYILYLNEYSYIGERCSNTQLAAVNKILEQFDDKVDVIFNSSKNHPVAVKQDNIGFYIHQTIQRVKDECDYIWYISTDEVYDDHIAEDILNKAKSKEIKTCIITQPICYIDNPHWFVNPPEDFTRPSIIPADPNIDLNVKTSDMNLTFHHLSFVLTIPELQSKFGNWGHRNDVAGQKGIKFIDTFNQIKTNKYANNFHPVQPSLYRTMAFANDKIHRELFLDWMYHLLTHSAYDDKLCVETLPKYGLSEENFYPLSNDERRLFSSIVSNFIPRMSNFLEIGAKVGWNSILTRLVSDINYVGIESDDESYSLAMSNLIKNHFPMSIMHGTVKQHVPKFPNNHFSAVFIDMCSANELQQSIIEVWPKLTDFAILFGRYDHNDRDSVQVLQNTINRAVEIDCPWGRELFRCYELYYNVFDELDRYKGAKFDTDVSMWMARIRKT